MVGTAIFGLLSAGLVAGILQARRLAEHNVWFVTAVTIAQGYVEQMKNMEYVELSYNPIPTKLDRDEPDPLIPGEWNLKLIDLFDTPDNPEDDMRMWVRPFVVEVTGLDRRYEITLEFRWESPARGGGFSTHQDRIDFIRSYVPSY